MEARANLNCQCNWDTESLNNYTSLDHIKKQLHHANWNYLRQHPELRAIIRVFIHELLNKQPDNIYEFSAALFNCNNSPLLVPKINQQLKQINKQLKNSCRSQNDDEIFLFEMDSTHSLLSAGSIGADIDSMLRFAMILKDEK